MKESKKIFFNKCEGIVKVCFTAATSRAATDRTSQNKTSIVQHTITLQSKGSNKPRIHCTKHQHRERVVNALRQWKHKLTKIRKKENWKRERCKFGDFHPNNFSIMNKPLSAVIVASHSLTTHGSRKRIKKQKN